MPVPVIDLFAGPGGLGEGETEKKILEQIADNQLISIPRSWWKRSASAQRPLRGTSRNLKSKGTILRVGSAKACTGR